MSKQQELTYIKQEISKLETKQKNLNLTIAPYLSFLNTHNPENLNKIYNVPVSGLYLLKSLELINKELNKINSELQSFYAKKLDIEVCLNDGGY